MTVRGGVVGDGGAGQSAWCYFAYGSNMNPARVRERGLQVRAISAATLHGVRLGFDKQAREHPGVGHACLTHDAAGAVEGVLYWLDAEADLRRMDRFERTPINYSREVVAVITRAGPVSAWTYFANPAVCRPGGRPSRAYLAHLLAGRPYLSDPYYQQLAAWPCAEDG
jgi:gamma-glutamylcyclotransferase (GGCT)/AIG2-like uncharacterized protein YtfP